MLWVVACSADRTSLLVLGSPAGDLNHQDMTITELTHYNERRGGVRVMQIALCVVTLQGQ